MPKETTPAVRSGTFMDLLDRSRDEFYKALPASIKGERFVRMILTAFRQSDRLQRCAPIDVIASFFELAQLGLEPNTPLGHSWVIPYGTRPQVVIGYKGYITLAYRAGMTLMATPVYEGDDFSYSLGTKPGIEHHPCSRIEDRGALKYSYAVAELPDGRVVFKVCTPADIDEAKRSSAAYKLGQQDKTKRDSPWYTNEPQMWAKTAIRRLAPFLPMAAELQRAAAQDEAADLGQHQQLSLPSMFQEDVPPVDPSTAADMLEDKLENTSNGG